MRDIKFRAWDKIDKRLTECDFLHFKTNGIGFAFTDKETDHAMVSQILNGDFELMQYTGLTDKNGKEIYEGDIVIIPNGLSAMESMARGEGTYSINEIYFWDGSWLAKDSNGTIDYLSDCFEESEIIGNIYENKELL